MRRVINMNEKKNNKKYIAVQCLAYIAIGGLSYLIGRNTQRKIFNDGLNYMARTGATISDIVDGKKYVCSVLKKKD